MRTTPRILALVMLAAVFVAHRMDGQSAHAVPSDAEIREILIDRIDKYQQSVGMVVGVIEPQGRRVVSYGKLDSEDSRRLDGDTVFEIGSITKVFTSVLLADMAQRGEVGLNDPVGKHLPPQVRVPERRGEQITMLDLATHTSGLPRMPTNVESSDLFNPFADYTVTQLYEFLSSYQLSRDIGSRFEYSNLGGALLGHALARRAAVSYETLVKTRIADPLKLNSTRIELTAEMKPRLAVGHGYGLEATPNWDLGALEAAGALHSTTNDLLRFLAANLGYTKTSLDAAMAAMLKVRRDAIQETIGLAWFVRKHENGEIVYHSGGTGGYLSFIGYDPKARTGVVVLSNSGTGAGVYDIGIHLLNPRIPLLDTRALTPPKPRKEVGIDPNLLDAYVGRYRFPSSQMASIVREGGHLLLRADGEVAVVFYPESNQSFFAKLMDAQITFNTDGQGHVTELIFCRNGSDVTVKRLD